MLKFTIELVTDLLGLFFPHLCQGCGQPLIRGEEVICGLCHFHLPKTYFHNDPDNPVNRTFWGRVVIEAAASYLYFHKGNNVQKLLHQLKYKNRPEIGICLGRWYGGELKYSVYFRDIEVIVPVPLHPAKQRKRGYNQSKMFAEGLASALSARLEAKCLYRAVNTRTQTRKSRYERWENVEHTFKLRNPEKLAGKHILLVDDVLTTGATLEACAHALLMAGGSRVSIATIAYAST